MEETQKCYEMVCLILVHTIAHRFIGNIEIKKISKEISTIVVWKMEEMAQMKETKFHAYTFSQTVLYTRLAITWRMYEVLHTRTQNITYRDDTRWMHTIYNLPSWYVICKLHFILECSPFGPIFLFADIWLWQFAVFYSTGRSSMLVFIFPLGKRHIPCILVIVGDNN